MFQKRHLEFLARALKDMPRDIVGNEAEHDALVCYLANKLATTNPRFCRDRFINASMR